MNIAELKASGQIIFEAVAGSQAYGTSTPQSDVDIRGIFIQPMRDRLSLFKRIDEVNSEKQDDKYYELSKFIKLASNCNPNIIELLWTPGDCLRVLQAPMVPLIENRHLFISKRAFHSFTGYAYAQIKKARGQNKMVYNPQPEERPTRDDFCWIIGGERGGFPYRPVRAVDAGYDLSRYHAAALEHTDNVFRLYRYGDGAKGVFRGDDTLVCESIPKHDERERFAALMVYSKNAYEFALKEWHRYWEWRNKRNEARWVSQESGEKNYDQKNMMHCMRLLLSGEHILKHGSPIVRFEGEQLELLRDIRAGKHEYDHIMEIVEAKMEELAPLKEASDIQHHPDIGAIDDLYMEMLGSV